MAPVPSMSPSSSTASMQTSGMKRGPSFASHNSSGSMSLKSAFRAPKKWRTNEQGAAASAQHPTVAKEVSFGCLQETVMFDRTDSSSQFKTIRRVAVSDLSFGSSASFMDTMKTSGSFRWGEQRNATWSTVNNPPTLPAHNARWSSAATNTMLPQNNLLLRQSGFTIGSTVPQIPSPSSTIPCDNSQHSVRLPRRCASPPPVAAAAAVGSGDTSAFATPATAAATRVTHLHESTAMPMLSMMHHVSLSSSSENDFQLEPAAPPRQPNRGASPMSILPEPMAPATPCPIFQTPPKRPVRCQSPPSPPS